MALSHMARSLKHYNLGAVSKFLNGIKKEKLFTQPRHSIVDRIAYGGIFRSVNAPG